MSIDVKEANIKVIAEIVNKLISCYEKRLPVNLSKLKQDIAKKYKIPSIPKLVEIIASLPEQYREKVYRLAWQEGHSAGYHEVYQWLTRLVEIFE